ncbi:MAG TPA: ribosome maturation factor RimP [Paenibacillaceae bacterium]|nr:ribosome maturation factor RimP [Paenibacillaceae bacterium]
MSTNIVALTEQLVEPIMQEQELELVEVQFVKEGKNWFLRVIIDKEGGVDIDDCGRVSEQLSKKLDEIDPITNPYFLEVSSPGAERPLKNEKDYTRAIGKHVHITTYEPINDARVFEGELLSFNGNELEVKEIKTTTVIPIDKVASARLAVVF